MILKILKKSSPHVFSIQINFCKNSSTTFSERMLIAIVLYLVFYWSGWSLTSAVEESDDFYTVEYGRLIIKLQHVTKYSSLFCFWKH